MNIAEQAIVAIRHGVAFLVQSPFACRKVGSGPFLRELVILLGGQDDVVLFEVVNTQTVLIGAVRHQRADDYH